MASKKAEAMPAFSENTFFPIRYANKMAAKPKKRHRTVPLGTEGERARNSQSGNLLSVRIARRLRIAAGLGLALGFGIALGFGFAPTPAPGTPGTAGDINHFFFAQNAHDELL